MSRRPVVAIDGPSGAGKSTVSKAVARRLGYVYMDTGAMYRAAALAAIRAGVDVADPVQVTKLAPALDIRLESGPDGLRTILGGEDVSSLIRTPEISMAASTISRHQPIRDRLTALQRRMGEKGGLVCEGRDMGTVVFPDSPAKFFLSASLEERARRRFRELREKGESVTLEATIEEMRRRDEQDSSRDIAPLKVAPGAVEIDSSSLTVDQVVEIILRRVDE
ncbi:MAG: (d)CMP kinase [Deltaproteobacteria bacterium]|nr:(d)CMP kinase [Deltaproteobacteria bacterium]